MKTFNKILPILFLSVYCAVVFHNIVPHIHTDTAVHESHQEIGHTSHDHDHGHHHANHENEKSTWTDYILGLLGDIQHPDLGDDHFENYIAQSTGFDLSSTHYCLIPVHPAWNVTFPVLEFEKTSDHLGHPKILYEQYHVYLSPLRGPPSIS
ncbi:MAG: hypothetical protein COA38_17405 [Fluviicola sp.]|nr:MAG: hypothetical protein COA38_17405 [Fluviicola sp.]